VIVDEGVLWAWVQADVFEGTCVVVSQVWSRQEQVGVLLLILQADVLTILYIFLMFLSLIIFTTIASSASEEGTQFW